MKTFLRILSYILILVGFIVGVVFYSPPHSELMSDICLSGIISSMISFGVSLHFQLIRLAVLFFCSTIVFGVWFGECLPPAKFRPEISGKVIDLPEEINQAYEGQDLTVLEVSGDTIFIGFKY